MRNILIFSIICIMLLGPLVSLATICAPCETRADCGSNEDCVEEFPGVPNTGKVCQDEDPNVPNAICVSSPLKYDKIEDIIDNVVNYVFYGALVVAPLMIIIAAAIIMTSAGDPNRTTLGKRIITWTIIGFAVILLAKGIMSLITNILGVK